MINMPTTQMRGIFKVESVHAETGKVTLLAEEAKNLLLTSGMREMSQRGSWLTSCQVGIDLSNDPDPSMTGMPGWVAGTSNIEENTVGAQPNPGPFYGYRRLRWRFPIGSISENKNINRVGAGWGTANDANLISLAKIVDSGGGETTPTWKADEYLDVSYEFRYYAPTVDATGTVTLNGLDYNYIIRAMAATDQAVWANGIGSQIQSTASVDSDWLAYDGDIGATIEDSPTGLTAESDNSNDYTIAPAGVQNISFGMNVGPGTNDTDGWSLTTGKLLRSLRIKTTAGWYQVQFDAVLSAGNGVPKTDQLTMVMEFNLAWSEAP